MNLKLTKLPRCLPIKKGTNINIDINADFKEETTKLSLKILKKIQFTKIYVVKVKTKQLSKSFLKTKLKFKVKSIAIRLI